MNETLHQRLTIAIWEIERQIADLTRLGMCGSPVLTQLHATMRSLEAVRDSGGSE